MRLQWLIPVASSVSTMLALSVIWWSSQRRKERQSYYRYELARMMVERFPESPDRILSWLREQEAGDVRRRREGMRLAAWLMLLGGVGALVSLRFTTSEDSAFGWIPIGLGLALFFYLFSSRNQHPAVVETTPQ